MKYIEEDGVCTLIYGRCDLDDEDLEITKIDGYGGLQGLQVHGYFLEWKTVDKLKKAIALAEKRWR